MPPMPASRCGPGALRKNMPINAYYSGNGEKVMSSMEKTYGDPAKAKSVFYALANKKKSQGDTTAKPPSEGYAIRKK